MSTTNPAPLVATPEAPVPAGGAAEWITGAGGLRLRAALFAAESPRGTVVLSGGRTEFIEKYYEVIGELLARGFTVLTHDWRGQGLSGRLLSDRLKGHAAGFDAFVADLGLIIDHYRDRLPGPRIAIAHSMGGCLTALALAKGVGGFDGAVFSAPMLGLAAHKSWRMRAAVALMAGLGQAGAYSMGARYDPFASTFEADKLTHDRVRYARTRGLMLADRDLVLGGVTWGWVASAFKAIGWLHAAPEVTRIAVPVTIVGAGLERLVDNAGQRHVAERLPAGRFVEIPGAFHEILMETDDLRAPFWVEFDALSARLG
jgi:lysophospholipase